MTRSLYHLTYWQWKLRLPISYTSSVYIGMLFCKFVRQAVSTLMGFSSLRYDTAMIPQPERLLYLRCKLRSNLK